MIDAIEAMLTEVILSDATVIERTLAIDTIVLSSCDSSTDDDVSYLLLEQAI